MDVGVASLSVGHNPQPGCTVPSDSLVVSSMRARFTSSQVPATLRTTTRYEMDKGLAGVFRPFDIRSEP